MTYSIFVVYCYIVKSVISSYIAYQSTYAKEQWNNRNNFLKNSFALYNHYSFAVNNLSISCRLDVT